MAGNSHQISNFSRKHTWVLPWCFLLWHHQRVIVYVLLIYQILFKMWYRTKYFSHCAGSTLESIEFGTSTGISDQVLAENINGSLKNLRVFKVAHSTILTMKSVQLLLENCSNLQEISDLTSFPTINRDELLALENHLIQSNIDVILG